MKRTPPEIRKHWLKVANSRCIITGRDAEIAHCHGGSISDELGPLFRPGMAQRQNHWLVLPLAPFLHRYPGGLDVGNVREWEMRYGKQTHLLEELSWKLGYDVFKAAGVVGYTYQVMDCPEETPKP